MKTKQGRTVTHEAWSLYKKMSEHLKSISGASDQMLGFTCGEQWPDEETKAYNDVIDKNTDDYGFPKPTNYGERDTIEADEQGYIRYPKIKEYIPKSPSKTTVKIIMEERMNKTLKKILELCEAEGLNITSFITAPTVTGHTIKLEVDVDDK